MILQIRKRNRDLGKWSKAVSGAASVGNNVKVRLVFVLVDTDNKHGSILARGRDDNFLGTTLMKQMNHTII